MKKLIVIGIVVVTTAVSFWGGMFYQRRQMFASRPFGMMGGNSSQGQRWGQGGFGGQGQRWGGQGAGGQQSQEYGGGNRGPGDGPRGERMISGRLDKIDGNKLTLTTNFGSVKINLSDKAKIGRSQATDLSDLKAGKQLIIKSSFDADGQLIGKSVIEE